MPIVISTVTIIMLAYLHPLKVVHTQMSLSGFLAGVANLSIENYSNFIGPRLENVSALNVSYVASGYQIKNGARSGVNFTIAIKKFYKNYSMSQVRLGPNTKSMALNLEGRDIGFLCQAAPMPSKFQNGTNVSMGEFMCEPREGINVKDVLYSPFTDELGLSSSKTTVNGSMTKISVLSDHIKYAGDTCTLIKSWYTVDTTYQWGPSIARYVSSGNLTECISNDYYAILFGKFVGIANETIPTFNSSSASNINENGIISVYSINATAINNQSYASDFRALPGPLAQYPHP
ncbi:MAG: hypothetical protein KGH59_01300 [Candidatus Micrarchaeota archaeon]|nr:hypothetical protein [Candidatus Micrarchaeota archaeon]